MEELFGLLETAASEHHPNPERTGCPGEEALATFARDPRAVPIDDPLFEHLSHCSPCFRFVGRRRSGR